MKRRLLLICIIFISIKGFTQSNEEILRDLKDLETPSYFRVGVGIGNKIFSTRNNSLNSQQNNSQLVFTPSIGYYHKSGLSLTTTGYLLNSGSNSGFLQYAINPAYDYSGEDVATTLSYTHYFTTNKYNTSVTPIENDFFGSVVSKKGWLRPGAQVGYAGGTFKEIVHVDTTVRSGVVNTHYNFYDTSTTKINSFSLTGTLEHTFSSKDIFTGKDNFAFTPQLMVNFGSNNQKTIQTSSGSYSYLVKRNRGKKRNYKKQSQTASNLPFGLESVGLNLQGDYNIGKFDIEPNLYLDYYIPSTNTKRLTEIFAVTFAYNF